MKYEFSAVIAEMSDWQKNLNVMGADGWALVAFKWPETDETTFKALFSREV